MLPMGSYSAFDSHWLYSQLLFDVTFTIANYLFKASKSSFTRHALFLQEMVRCGMAPQNLAGFGYLYSVFCAAMRL
jgi:hypothetical protein